MKTAASLLLMLLLFLALPLRAQSGTNTVNLSWGASSGIVSNYFIERSIGTTNNFTALAVLGPVTNYQDRAITEGTFYWYRVRAGNPAGMSDYSNTAGTLVLFSPGKPGQITITITQ
jgi:hypothetical protein